MSRIFWTMSCLSFLPKLHLSAVGACSKVNLGIWEIDANAGRLSVIRRRKMQTLSFCGGNATLSVFSVPISNRTPIEMPNLLKQKARVVGKDEKPWREVREVFIYNAHWSRAELSRFGEVQRWAIGGLKCPRAVCERTLSFIARGQRVHNSNGYINHTALAEISTKEIIVRQICRFLLRIASLKSHKTADNSSSPP